MDLLSSSDSEDEKVQKKSQKTVAEDGIKINRKFASEFERRQRYKDLQRAKELLDQEGSDDDSESDESEDDDAEMLSPDLNLKILQTINTLKKRDPKIYDPNVKFFEDVSSESDDEAAEDGNKQKSTKKMRFKDVLRQQLVEEEDNDTDDIRTRKEESSGSKRISSQLLYDKEQAELRKQFLKAANNDSDDNSDEDLLQVKEKTSRQIEEEERAYQEALSEMKSLEKDKEAEDSAFLQEFLAKKMWKDPTPALTGLSDDEDEEEFDAAEQFESKYNFRFEELQAENLSPALREDLASQVLMQQSMNQVVGHARTVQGSVRRTDDKRKKDRELRKEKKEKEKRQKEAELRRLKNLKKQELQERLSKIGEMSGLKQLGIIDEAFLEEDWDPEKHAKLMAAQFDDDYYDQEEDDIGALVNGKANFDENEHYNLLEDEEGNVLYNEDDDMEVPVDDNDYDAAAPTSDNVQQQVSQMMDEYYALDYEDIVAGIPCRFKYRQVEKEDYGLDIEDILLADDSELNRYVSLKKIAPYDFRQKEAKDLSKKRKRLRAALRERLEQEQAESNDKKKGNKLSESVPIATVSNGEDEQGEGKKRKRRKRKHREDDREEVDANSADAEGPVAVDHTEPASEHLEEATEDQADVAVDEPVNQGTSHQKKKKHRTHSKKKKPTPGQRDQKKDVDPKKQRLALYK